MKYVCVDCQQQYVSFRYECTCHGMLDIRHDFSEIDGDFLKDRFNSRLSERMGPYASGVWRYKELIFPEVDESHIVSKYEGNTGLYQHESIARYAGVRNVWLKAQSENPSGSFKDNGMTVALTHGKSLGYTRFTCSSTGNTSSSLAMYAALAQAHSYVFVPNKNISLNKVLQTLAFGAHIFSFDGTYDDGITFLEQHSEELGLYICNSINPFRIEGQKSIVYEIAHMLNWNLPEWIVVPGGALSNVSALGKGLSDLYTLGFIDKLPRVVVVQAEGTSPFYNMIVNNSPQLEAELEPYTVASALNIGNPPSWRKAKRTLEETNGIAIAVTDEEILNAKAIIDASGIGCEPASAATIAGVKKLVAQYVIDKDESIACILTGNMLKDTDVLRNYHLERQMPYSNSLIHAELSVATVFEAMRK
ncbi:threonine synthase [Paenibacillus sp. 481]|uniref:threonine synthase n=1 Tax=Paenibacillus sp. 481 TaxID=2835869 RepID=UPI001E504185|nr:threonine synthase [Paenibacillus sp. 481]UHA73258.1 threonine synthase [Paenibacillus sp. 481]